jgi:hypothetical protein
MAGIAQPTIPGTLVVEMDDVVAAETGGLPPSAIVNQPNSFTLSTRFVLKDVFAPAFTGQVFAVQHHVERQEDGLRLRLPNTVTVTAGPAVNGEIVMPYTSSVFTTGPTGSGANLEIAPGETEGNFRILTQLVAQNPGVRGIVSAFYDGQLLSVI